MDDPIVSVIIPVYKAEPFLAECLDSVIGQDYPALEIILVDDGSPDSCPEICDRYAETCARIRTIHQDNRGPGPARNAGLEAAAGRYVAFVDSDDRLDGADAIRRMAERAEAERADIVVGAFRRLSGGQPGEIMHHRFRGDAYAEGTDFRLKGLILSDHLLSVWCKLYRRSFLIDNALRFPDYPFREDQNFNMLCYACRPAYAFVDESVYLHRADNSGSLSHRYWEDYIPAYMAAVSGFRRFLSERGIADGYDDLIDFYLCFGLFLLAKQELTHRGIPEAVKALSSYGRNPLVCEMAGDLARGRHISRIESKAWRVMLWGAALLCRLHAYGLLALGIWVMLKTEADKRVASAVYES